MDYKKILLLVVNALSLSLIYATHIVGGEMTYTHIGGRTYNVTLTVYRDDFNGNPNALFDDPAYIALYDQNNNFVISFEVDADPLRRTDTVKSPIVNPCLDEPNNVLIQQQIYNFNITVPNGAVGYHLVYSRCCRNGALINNLLNPDDEGATYTTFIPPTNSFQNTSPFFNEPPPIFICVQKPFTYDHSATDADGDSLFYSLCSPYKGLDPNAPIIDQGSAPPRAGGLNPSFYGPPFVPVDYAPGYSGTAPFPAGSSASIDASTGLLSINPSNFGAFVVGICVEEYRNGNLVNTVQRDFQYVVTDCDIPFANIPTLGTVPETDLGVDVPDNILGIYEKNCDDFTVDFENTSVMPDNSPATPTSADYFWDFGDGNTSTAFEPTHTFPDTGAYIVTLAITVGDINQGFCSDTGYYVVYTYPVFEPDFSITDACENTQADFLDLSTTAIYDNVVLWDWDFGDGTPNSNLQNPSHVYANPGNYTVTMFARTDKGCTKEYQEQVTISPNPTAAFTANAPLCLGQEVNFTNNSSISTGSIVSFNWDLDNGSTRTVQNPAETYSAAGTYNVTLIVESAAACSDTVSQNVVINPLPLVNINANSPICPNTSVQLSASGGTAYAWTPANLLDNSNISTPTASLDTTPSTFFVQVTDANGCINTDSVFIDLFPLPQAEAGEDTSVCLNVANVVSFNTTVQLQASGGLSYLWSPATGLNNTTIANPTASPQATTTYNVEVTDANGCIANDSVKVVVLNPALELIQVDIDSVCAGDTVVVNVLDLGNVTTYAWSPAAFVTNPTIREPGFFPPNTRDYFLNTSNYCYLDADTVTIDVISPPPVDAGPLDSICLGDDPYQLNAQPNNLELYLWTTTDPTISDVNIPNPTVSPLTDTWYYVYAEDVIGSLVCDSRDSVLILAYDTPQLSLSFPLDYVGYICLGDSLDLTATTNDGILFDWTASNSASILNGNTAVATVVPPDSTLFTHTTTNIHACSTTDSIFVNVQLPVTASIAGDTTMCEGLFVDLQASGGLYYRWYPNEPGLFSSSSFSATQVYPDTSMTVFVDVSNDCFNDTAFHDIRVFPLPAVDAGNDIEILRDETGFLLGTGAGTPTWYTVDRTLDGIVENPFTYNPEMSPFNTTTYILEVLDEATQCKNFDTATVFVDVLTLLAFPTGFSPNGDGSNDIARIIKYLNIQELEYLAIYDRWGEEVFRTSDLDTGWDGTFKGKNAPIGMYAWLISATTKDQEKIIRKGNITIIR